MTLTLTLNVIVTHITSTREWWQDEFDQPCIPGSVVDSGWERLNRDDLQALLRYGSLCGKEESAIRQYLMGNTPT